MSLLLTNNSQAQSTTGCAYEAGGTWDPDIARAEPDGDNGGSTGWGYNHPGLYFQSFL